MGHDGADLNSPHWLSAKLSNLDTSKFSNTPKLPRTTLKLIQLVERVPTPSTFPTPFSIIKNLNSISREPAVSFAWFLLWKKWGWYGQVNSRYASRK